MVFNKLWQCYVILWSFCRKIFHVCSLLVNPQVWPDDFCSAWKDWWCHVLKHLLSNRIGICSVTLHNLGDTWPELLHRSAQVGSPKLCSVTNIYRIDRTITITYNATFNNISVISWWSVLFDWWRKPEYPGETTVHLALIEIRTHNMNGDRHWLHR
jgi:hypothetical protein